MDMSHTYVKYATNVSGKWVHEDVYNNDPKQKSFSSGNGTMYDEQSVLVVDADGVPHYLYNDRFDQKFKHAIPLN